MFSRPAAARYILLVTAGLLVSAARADDPEAEARAALAAYGKNIRSFPAYKCRYTVTHGTAASIEDVRAGRYDVTAVWEHVTAVDGSNFRSSRQAKKLPEADGRGNMWKSLRSPESCLRTGEDTLIYDHAGTATLHKPDHHITVGFNPLDMGLFDSRLDDAPDALGAIPKCHIFSDDVRPIDGRPSVGVQLVNSELGTRALIWRLALDPSRGHLPCRGVLAAAHANGDEQATGHEFWLLDAKDCGRGRFFPTRFVWVSSPREKGGGQFRVTEYAAAELIVDRVPTREDLSIELPAGTTLALSHPDGRPSFTLQRDTAIHPDDLAGLVADLEARLPPQSRTGLVARLARWWPWLAAGVGGAVAVLLVQLLLTRRRRTTPGTAA